MPTTALPTVAGVAHLSLSAPPRRFLRAGRWQVATAIAWEEQAATGTAAVATPGRPHGGRRQRSTPGRQGGWAVACQWRGGGGGLAEEKNKIAKEMGIGMAWARSAVSPFSWIFKRRGKFPATSGDHCFPGRQNRWTTDDFVALAWMGWCYGCYSLAGAVAKCFWPYEMRGLRYAFAQWHN